MFSNAPEWFVNFYLTYGEQISKHITTPTRRSVAKMILSTLQKIWTAFPLR
jgi:hypothetical protein